MDKPVIEEEIEVFQYNIGIMAKRPATIGDVNWTYMEEISNKLCKRISEHDQYNSGFDAGSAKAYADIIAHIKERASDLWLDNKDAEAAALRSIIKEIENL